MSGVILREPFKRYLLTIRLPFQHKTVQKIGYWSPKGEWRYSTGSNRSRVRGIVLKFEEIMEE